MKILNATIYGFGKWVDYSVDFDPDSFTAIYGKNESGKSTLHQFVLFMLFGLPPKQRNFYRPKTSGKMGGRLTVEDAEVGVFTIERLDEVNNGAAICYTEDGKEFDEVWLNEQLKGLTKKTYQSIFSFSSMDLHLINNMKEDDLAEVLLGIGMTGSAAIYSVEKRLDQQMGELFKPRGAKPLINQQLTSLDHLYTQLQQAKNNEETYRELKGNQNTLNNDILEYQQRIIEEKKELKTIEKQQQALPYIQEYMEAAKQLKQFPEVLHFPEQGIARLEKVKDKLLPLKSELNILRDNQQKYEQKIKTLQQEVDDFPRDQVTGLLEKKEAWQNRNKELARLEQNLSKTSAQIENELNQMDAVIKQEVLAEMHLPFHIEREWLDIKESKEKFQLEKEKVEQEQEELIKQERYVQKEKAVLETAILPEKQKKELEEKTRKFQEQAWTINIQESAANQKMLLEKNKEKKQQKAKLLLAGSLFVGVVMGGAGFFLESSILYFLMIAVLLFGPILWYTERKSLSEMEELLQQDGRELQSQEITKEFKDEAEELLSQNENRLLKWRALEGQWKNLNLQRLKWEEKRNFIDRKNKWLQKRTAAQVAEYPFLELIEIRYWPEMYHRLKHIIQLIRGKIDIERKMEILKAKNTTFQEEVDQYFQQEQKLPLQAGMEMLEEYVENTNNLEKQILNYKELLDENYHAQDSLKQKLQIYENEMAALLASASVSAEDEFYEKARQIEDQTKYKKDRLKAKKQIFRILPETDLQEIPYESSLSDSQQQTKTTVENLEASLDKKRDELAKVNANLENLEASENYSSLMHQMEMDKEELNHLAKKWAILKTAKEMLLETKRNYKDKYLHKVMEKTTDYFTRLTEGRYVKVFAPGKDNSFYAVASDHARYHVNELSRGTIDQLYISLRLAISDIMSKEYKIPFILDDAFIHFDSIRTQRVMEVLYAISGTQQIIVFSCKKEIINQAPDSLVIQLEKSNVKEVFS
ncbi:AAA family ATPase [Virgibacillus oceani]